MERHQFFEDYRPTNFVDDPLPVRVLSHSIWKGEILGQALDWATQYLHQRGCPNYMISPLLGKVVQELKTTDLSECVATNSPSRRYGGGDEDEVDADCVENAKYQPLKLMQAVAGKVDDICLKYKEANDRIDQDFPNISLADSENSVVHALSAWSIKNSRRTQEDRMVVLPSIHKVFQLKDPLNYFAVFDGHNGIEAAAYSCAHLHRHLVTSPDFPWDMNAALTYAFECTDTSLLMKFREENLRSGTTAVVTLLMPGHLYCAWAGDSQAVLVKRGKAVDLVNPHKPEREDELQRIKSVGGEVIKLGKVYRVNGNLAVSRAIGDPDYKDCVTSTPEISHVELDGSEEFLVLACDGLWDVIEPDRAVEILKKTLLSSEPGAFDSVSKELTKEAKLSGSGDNITVIVVSLKPREELVKLYSSDTMNGTAEPMEIGGGLSVADAAAEVPVTKPTTPPVTKLANAKPAPGKPTSATKAPAKTSPRPPVASARTSLAPKPPTSSTARPLTNKAPTATARQVPSTTRLAAKPLEKKPAAPAPTRQPLSTRAPVSSRLATAARPSTASSRPGTAAAGKPKPEETEKSGTGKTAAAPRPRPSTTLASTTRTSLIKPKVDVKVKVDAAAKPAAAREPIAPRRSTPSMTSRPATAAAPASRVSITKSTTGLPAKPRVSTASVPLAAARTSATAPKRPSTSSAAAPKPSAPIKKAPVPLAKKDVSKTNGLAAAPSKVPEKRIITNRTKSAASKISEVLKAEGPSVTETVAPPMTVTSVENPIPSNETMETTEAVAGGNIGARADEEPQKLAVFDQMEDASVVPSQAEPPSSDNIPVAEDEPKALINISDENAFVVEPKQLQTTESHVPSQDAPEPMAAEALHFETENAPSEAHEAPETNDHNLSHQMKQFSLEDRIFQQMGIQDSVEHDEDVPESPVDDHKMEIGSTDLLASEPVQSAPFETNLGSSLENVTELQKMEQLEENLLMDDKGDENADLLAESPIPDGSKAVDKVNESLETLRETPVAELEQVSPNITLGHDQKDEEDEFMQQRGGSAFSEASGASFEGQMEAIQSPLQDLDIVQQDMEVENPSSPAMEVSDQQLGSEAHSPSPVDPEQDQTSPSALDLDNYPGSPKLAETLDEPEKTFSEEENALHRYDVEPTSTNNSDMIFDASSPPPPEMSSTPESTFAVDNEVHHRSEELAPERMDEEEDIKISHEPVEPSEHEKSFTEEENILHRYDPEPAHEPFTQDDVAEVLPEPIIEPVEPEPSFTAEENALHQYDVDNGNYHDTCFATDINQERYSPMEISTSNTHDFGLPSSATNPFQMDAKTESSSVPEADLHLNLQQARNDDDHEHEPGAFGAAGNLEDLNQKEVTEAFDMDQAMAANTQFEQYATNPSDFQGHNVEDLSNLTATASSDPTSQTIESHGYSASPDSGYVNPLISPDVQDDMQTGRTSSFNSEFSSEPHHDDNDLDHSEEKLLPEEPNSLSDANLLPNQPTPELEERTPEPAHSSLDEAHHFDFKTESKNPFTASFEEPITKTVDSSPFNQMSHSEGLHSESGGGGLSEIPKMSTENDRLLQNQFADMFHGTQDPPNHNNGFPHISSGFETSTDTEKIHGGIALENNHFVTNGSHSSHDRNNLPDVTPEFNVDFHSPQPGTNLDLVDFDKLSSSGIKSQSDALLD